MATIKTFGKEYSYVLECERNKSVEKLLKLLESKALDLFGQINLDTITEGQILNLLKERLNKAEEEKAKQAIEALLAETKELIKSEKKKEAEQTIWHYKLPTLDAQFDKGEEIVFQGDVADDKSIDNIITKVVAANEVKKQAKIIKACLVRVENLFNDDGQLVEWPINSRTKDNTSEQGKIIAVLPHLWRIELAGIFRNAASISEEEIKN